MLLSGAPSPRPSPGPRGCGAQEPAFALLVRENRNFVQPSSPTWAFQLRASVRAGDLEQTGTGKGPPLAGQEQDAAKNVLQKQASALEAGGPEAAVPPQACTLQAGLLTPPGLTWTAAPPSPFQDWGARGESPGPWRPQPVVSTGDFISEPQLPVCKMG